MDSRLLYEFLMLAQVGNYLEASELLFISQPTLSRHIKALEDELNKPLFERTTRHLHLSKYGHILLPYAQKVIELNDQFLNALQIEDSKAEKGQISIMTIPAMSYYGIVSVLSQFRREHPEYTLNISTAYAESIMETLRQGDCELGFIREHKFRESDDKVVRLPFASDHIVAFVQKDHRLAAFDSISLLELKGEKLITFPRNTLVYEIINAACMSVGITPYVVMSDHNVHQVIDYVRLGMGVGLLMDKHLNPQYSDLSDIKVINVTPKHRSYIYLCYLKNAYLSDGARAFIKMIEEKSAPG